MLKTKIIPLSMLLIISSTLTGCWDSVSIEKKNIVTLVVVDYEKEQEKYKFYLELANIMGKPGIGKANPPSYSLLMAQGDSLIKARDAVNRKSDNQIFLAAVRAVVFSKGMAQKGIEEYLNRMKGNVDYRKSLDMVTSSTSPINLISDIPENDASVGDAIEDTLKDQMLLGNSFHVTAGDVMQAIADRKVGFLLPEINNLEDETSLTGYSVFKDAKAIGVIPAAERNGIVFFLAPNPAFFYEVAYKGKNLKIISSLKSKKIEPLLKKDQLTFSIDMTFDGQIEYIDKLFPITVKDKELISKKLGELIKEDLMKTLQVSQKKYRCDYLHFYKYFRAYKQSKFKTVDWEQMYADSIMKVRVKASIKGAQALDVNAK
jgi:spore germination protein KC